VPSASAAIRAARVVGVARVAFGVALVAVPDRVGRSWLGDPGATPAAQVAVRGLGVRDAVIGAAVVLTAGDPSHGPRWTSAGALGDLADIASTTLAARHLPSSGVRGTVALAGAAAAVSLAVGEWSRRAHA